MRVTPDGAGRQSTRYAQPITLKWTRMQTNKLLLDETRKNEAEIVKIKRDAIKEGVVPDLNTEDPAIIAKADLAVTESDSVDPVVAGNVLSYTLVVTNTGPALATGILLTDTLPLNVTFHHAA